MAEATGNSTGARWRYPLFTVKENCFKTDKYLMILFGKLARGSNVSKFILAK